MCSGDAVSDATRMPEECAEAISARVSRGPPSCWSRQLSASVRTPSIPSDVETWPVTVSASTRSTLWPRRDWRTEARFVAMVVLPTPPLGLKTARIVARWAQPSASIGPLCRTGPDPSSTVWLRMHMASTRHRSDSAEYGRVKYSSSTSPELGSSRVEGALRDDHQGRDRPPAVTEQRRSTRATGRGRSRRRGSRRPRRAGWRGTPRARPDGDGRDREPGGAKLGGDRSGFLGGKGDSDGRSGHDLAPPISGSRAATVSSPWSFVRSRVR